MARERAAMKERELRACATCAVCRQKVLGCGSFLFYRVSIERFGIDLAAVKRQAGLEMMLNGHVALAQMMGPDQDMALPIMDPLTLTICDACAMKPKCIAMLAEQEPLP